MPKKKRKSKLKKKPLKKRARRVKKINSKKRKVSKKSRRKKKVIKKNLLASDGRYGDSPRGNAFEIERREHLLFNFVGSHPQVHFLTSLIH